MFLFIKDAFNRLKVSVKTYYKGFFFYFLLIVKISIAVFNTRHDNDKKCFCATNQHIKMNAKIMLKIQFCNINKLHSKILK